MLHQQQQEIPASCCAPQPQPVRRSPWQVLASYDRLAAIVKALPVHPYVALHGNYMIPHLMYFPFLQSRTSTVRPCCNLLVFCSWDMTFHEASCKIHYFLPQFWPTKFEVGITLSKTPTIRYMICSQKKWCIMWYDMITYHIISYHIISYHIISYHIISYHIISYRILSYRIISYRITWYWYNIRENHKVESNLRHALFIGSTFLISIIDQDFSFGVHIVVTMTIYF